MKIDLETMDDKGLVSLSADEQGFEKIYSEGIAFMLLKGLYNMDDKDALAAFKTYAELHLKIDTPGVGDVGDEWAYWTPGDIK
jgi:hypothetical protein